MGLAIRRGWVGGRFALRTSALPEFTLLGGFCLQTSLPLGSSSERLSLLSLQGCPSFLPLPLQVHLQPHGPHNALHRFSSFRDSLLFWTYTAGLLTMAELPSWKERKDSAERYFVVSNGAHLAQCVLHNSVPSHWWDGSPAHWRSKAMMTIGQVKCLVYSRPCANSPCLSFHLLNNLMR